MPGKGRRETLSNTALVNLSQRKKVGRRAIYLHSNLNLFKTLISSLLTANDQATNPAKHRTYSTMLRQRSKFIKSLVEDDMAFMLTTDVNLMFSAILDMFMGPEIAHTPIASTYHNSDALASFKLNTRSPYTNV
ncbi:hypothetical protein GGP41_007025 [Bipolaris sorokiniana]|uniref:Uncharacterized protein n=1 Tax=Cochliobolus sativus TaxID=45130 RepID=A0A8H5ZSF6_COCSA|nr:hypothetical protein GGP41_007025 [Bipolaris sorokiniana]